MTDKIDHTGYQLDPKQFDAETPMIFKGVVHSFITYLNDEDINHDGKSDVAEVAPFIIKALPIIAELAPLIDESKLKALLAKTDIFTDAVAAEAALAKGLALVTAAKTLAK